MNLRGEYHVENVTVFEDSSPKAQLKPQDGMELDQEEKKEANEHDSVETEAVSVAEPTKATSETPVNPSKAVKFDAQDEKSKEKPADIDTLYPIFWSLQEDFSNPTRLFDDNNLQKFQRGLAFTLVKFKEVQQDLQARGTSKIPDDGKRGVKRKRSGQEDEF